MSAAEFLAARQADPERVAKQEAIQRQRDERETAVREASARAIDALAIAGYPVSSLDELLPRYAPLPMAVADIVLDHLPQVQDGAVQEQMVRALGASGSPIDGAALLTLFENTSHEHLRYAIANTFAYGQVTGIANWLPDAIRDKRNASSREMLAVAVAKHLPRNEANALLVALLDELPGHAALALSESGTTKELDALDAKYANARGWEKQQIGKAIAMIKRRSNMM